MARIARTMGWLAAGSLWMMSSACLNPPLEKPDTKVVQQTPVRVPQNEKNQVDILFMVDNSFSMDAMTAELRNRFGDFLQVFSDLAKGGTAADLHIAVVTSDYGAGDSGVANGCDKSPGGQNGLFQATALDPAAKGCAGPTGTPFISYVFAPDKSGNGSGNLPAGQDLTSTFTCMASVGSGGCGFEHQLESVYAALSTNDAQAKSFLRDDALLAVVFVTNEDDGSAAPSAKFYEQGADPKVYGPYDTYRQTRFAVFCGGQPIPYGDGMTGSLTGCDGAPNALADGPTYNSGLAYDVQRYINLFTNDASQGGIKADARDNVLLFAIDGAETPVQTILADPNSGQGKTVDSNGNPTTVDYTTCSSIGNNCVERLQHVCQNKSNPQFFADPSVRLNRVVKSATFHQTSSICGEDLNSPPDFTGALKQLGMLISSQISPGCIPAPLSSTSDPQCVVVDITTNADKTQTKVPIGSCVQTHDVPPCWKAEKKDLCAGLSPDGMGVTIVRGNTTVAADTTAQVECTTNAVTQTM